MNLLNNQDNPATGSAEPTKQSQAPLSDSVPPPPPPPLPSGGAADQGSGLTGGLKVSLMPEDEEEAGGSLRRWLIVMFLTLLIETVGIGGGYLYLTNLEAERNEARVDLEQRIDKVKADIKEAEEDAKQAAEFDSRAHIAGELLDTHLFWTKFFKYLNTQTKKNVRYQNFSGDFKTHTVTLDAIGASYRDVAEQIVLLRENPMIEEVITTSASARTNAEGKVEGVSFSLVITLHPEVWLPATESVTEND